MQTDGQHKRSWTSDFSSSLSTTRGRGLAVQQCGQQEMHITGQTKHYTDIYIYTLQQVVIIDGYQVIEGHSYYRLVETSYNSLTLVKMAYL